MRHWNELPERILWAAERLKQVQIECMPAIDLIKRFRFPDVLIYADPPYLKETRTAHVKQQYSHEMLTEQEHIELLEVLISHPGYVVISGYESELYRNMLEDTGWRKRAVKSNDQSGRIRQEAIWMNYDPPARQLEFEEIEGGGKEYVQKRLQAKICTAVISEGLCQGNGQESDIEGR